MECKILNIEHAENILEFEKKIAKKQLQDKPLMEQGSSALFSNNEALDFLNWDAPWRKEALEFYFPLGWSFFIHAENNEKEVLAYFMAQVIPFFSGHTQVLWVEHLTYLKDSQFAELIDVAYKWCRSKHLQGIVLKANKALFDQIDHSYKIQEFQGELLFLKTW